MRQHIPFSKHKPLAKLPRHSFTGRHLLSLLLCAALLFAAGCSPKESANAPGTSDGLLDLFVQQGAPPSEEGGAATSPTPPAKNEGHGVSRMRARGNSKRCAAERPPKLAAA